MDLTQDTVSDASHIRDGYVGHLNDGTSATGSYSGASPTLTTKSITANGTYNASSDNADGYSSVTVNVSGSSKNIQTYSGYGEVNTTDYSATSVSLTVAKTGTYKCSWIGFRNTTGGTNGTRLYVNDVAKGSAHTSGWIRSYAQYCEETLTLNKDDVVTVYGKVRGTTYWVVAGNLIIQEQ